MEIYQTGSIIVILVGKRVLSYNIQFYIVIVLYNNPDFNERFKELLFKNYYNDCPVYTVFDNYIQFDEEEYDLEEEDDTIDRNFYDSGVNDMIFCSDDNTYTNQQNQQFNPVEIHYDVNEQENSHQDPSDYVSINGKLRINRIKWIIMHISIHSYYHIIIHIYFSHFYNNYPHIQQFQHLQRIQFQNIVSFIQT